jgi:hypothetical protein
MDESKAVDEESGASPSSAPAASTFDAIVELMRIRHGEEWGNDEEANLHFALDAASMLRKVDGAHLIGEPDIEDGKLTLTFWVDFPIEDLMSVDQLAFDILSRVSDEFVYSERRLEAKVVRYSFVTGSEHHGHIGSLVLAGSYAADFVDREKVRTTGMTRFHA